MLNWLQVHLDGIQICNWINKWCPVTKLMGNDKWILSFCLNKFKSITKIVSFEKVV